MNIRGIANESTVKDVVVKCAVAFQVVQVRLFKLFAIDAPAVVGFVEYFPEPFCQKRGWYVEVFDSFVTIVSECSSGDV